MHRIVRNAAELSEPVLQDFFAYWDDIRQGRRFPNRGDIDPIQMPVSILPHLVLIDVLSDIGGFRYRLVGTKVVERVGYELRGRLASDGVVDDPQALCQSMALVASDAQPRHLWLGCDEGPQGFRSIEQVFTPVTRSGDQIDMLFGATVFHRDPPQPIP